MGRQPEISISGVDNLKFGETIIVYFVEVVVEVVVTITSL